MATATLDKRTSDKVTDGGIYANNLTLCAWIEACKSDYAEVVMLSISMPIFIINLYFPFVVGRGKFFDRIKIKQNI